ncbi:MAG: 2-amino-4-hydroxy-6-hydroxymethyldihydropteridine diphosphokinase [Spirochaetales bacterium]|nr:2-amino-4-hydroxy-6-hydroxymethyldihydropteridine diphosphokinase [Spirochaetales bacterium]
MNLVYLSIGTNLGNKIENLKNAISRLSSIVTIDSISSVYETEPLNVQKQDNFLNIAIEVQTNFPPLELIEKLKKIESEMGRVLSELNKPRIIDIDIIFYNSIILDEVRIQVPHPRAHKRAFVIFPIMDLNPAFVHPILNKSLMEISKNLSNQRISKLENVDIEKIR